MTGCARRTSAYRTFETRGWAKNETPPSLPGLTSCLLSKTGKTARNRVAERLAEPDLRLWHMAELAALVDFGPHVQRELASRIAIDRSDIVKVVDDLAVAGLVDRARDAGDRRRATVTPAPAGRSVIAEISRTPETCRKSFWRR
jgi:DNA-binding MarR family transcriptional regulator